ncbi:MAG: hypothetical protein ACFFKA_10665 [Candidatus Thorarchaeota archaeon]
MTEFIINDEWVLKRISSQSSTFEQWLSGLMNSVKELVEKKSSEGLAKLDKNKELKKLEQLNNLANLDKDLKTLSKELNSLESLKDNFSFSGTKFTQFIQDSIQKEFKRTLQQEPELPFEFNLDFLTGKTKSLSAALYDVSIERGIDLEGILYLIKALPDLEAFLYSTSVKKYYRDHTEHALRVAVLGDFLLEQDLGYGRLLSLISDLIGIEKNALKSKFWWITGLVHDIGYPLGKMTTAINYSLINQLLKCYPSLDLEFIPFEIGLSWKGRQEDYLKIIENGFSKEAKELLRLGSGYYAADLKPQISRTYLKSKDGHPEFNYTSEINLDHGVLSAMSLLNGLGTPEEIINNDEFYGYVKVAKAIAIHNFKPKLKDFVFDEQPLTFFLMLIDELQEWARPIPMQLRDTYFTTELKKVSLLDEISLILDDFSWYMQFKNAKAKQLMGFNFKNFSEEKNKMFKRLDRGNQFSETKIHLQDISIKQNKSDEIINETHIII